MASNKTNRPAGDRAAQQEFSDKNKPAVNNEIANATQDFSSEQTFLEPLRQAAIAAGARIAIGGVESRWRSTACMS